MAIVTVALTETDIKQAIDEWVVRRHGLNVETVNLRAAENRDQRDMQVGFTITAEVYVKTGKAPA